MGRLQARKERARNLRKEIPKGAERYNANSSDFTPLPSDTGAIRKDSKKRTRRRREKEKRRK